MDYDLSRIDYVICGITYPDTMKILPAIGPKTQQKITIGDKNGVLQTVVIKDEEPIIQFKTLPGKSITCVQLAHGTGTQTEKIFAASGNEVKGYTKKGKVFLTLETSVSETITSMYILGGDLILCSGRTVTHYRDLKEFHSYLCEDRVLDVAAFTTPNGTRIRLLVLVANKGVIILENGQTAARAIVPTGPARLAVPLQHSQDIYVFYGAADGSIGLIAYEESLLSSKCLVEGKGLGSVMCVGWYLNNAGTHLAIGRHDGCIQLYLIDLENLSNKPRLKYTYLCGEPVTSIGGGCVGSEDSELLAATFSGRIFALRPRRLIPGASINLNIPQDALAARRVKLESEVARLEKQVVNEREKYQRSTRSLQTEVSTPPLLDIQFELSGANREGWQEAKIMSAVPLDMLFIYCVKKLEMQTDNAAVLSICSSQDLTTDLLATVRCQAGTRRLWVRMRNPKNESQLSRPRSTRVMVYALPAAAPRVARLVTMNLPALPHYSQHEDADTDNETRSWCQLRVSGKFSVAEITSWLTEALPGDLPRPATNVVFARSHTLLRTLLICNYQRGEAVFKSDNISTIAVIKDLISNCSVEKNVRVDISCDIPKECCVKAFENIQDFLHLEYKKSKDIALKKAISALDLDSNIINPENPVLIEDYMRVWKSPYDEINDDIFNNLLDTVEQWYSDWCALTLRSGEYNNEKIQLHEALQGFQLENVMRVLSNKSNSP